MKTQTFLIRCEYPDGDHIPTQEFVENIQEYFAANIMDGERGRLVVKPIYQPKEEGLVEEENKPKPKFKVGDKIKLKFTFLTDIFGVIGYESEGYRITNISNGLTYFIGYSIEHYYELVEEEIKPLTTENMDNIIEEAKTYWDGIKDAWICPEGYTFKDENGNVINAQKIVLEKKKKKYPKTFLECCDMLNIGNLIERGVKGYKAELFDTLQKLYICRDAYWQIAGEEMGLGIIL